MNSFAQLTGSWHGDDDHRCPFSLLGQTCPVLFVAYSSELRAVMVAR